MLEKGMVHIPNDQKARILNVDETAPVFDGTSHRKYCLPKVTCYDGTIPILGSTASKISEAAIALRKYCTWGSNSTTPQISTSTMSADHKKTCLKTVHF